MNRFMPTTRLWKTLTLALVVACVAGSVDAQMRGRSAGRCRVSGTVTDHNGVPLAGVTLYLNSTETKTKNTKVKSNKKGSFVHPLVERGPYKFEFEKEGYRVYYLLLDNKASDDSDMNSFGPAHFSMAQADRQIQLAVGGLANFTVKMVPEGEYEALAMAAAEGSMPDAEISEKVMRQRHPAEEGREMFDLKNYSGAITKFEEAKKLEGGDQDPGLSFAMAQAYFHLGSYDQSFAELKHVKELDGNKPRQGVSYFQALIADKQGRKAEAVSYMEEEISSSEDPQASMLATMGGLYRDIGDNEKAISTFEDAIEKDAANLGALMNLGSLYNSIGDEKKAELYFQKAAEAGASKGKKGAAIFFNIGALNVNEGNTREATDAFERAVSLNPNYAAAHRELGYAYRDLGDTQKAMEHFKLYLKLQPKAPDKPELELWIKANS